jgi:hypothetical protein
VRDDGQSKGLRVSQLLFEIERGDHGAGLNRACWSRGGHLFRLEGSLVRFLVGLLSGVSGEGGVLAELGAEGLFDMFSHAFVSEGQIAFDMTIVDGGLKVTDGIAGFRRDGYRDDGGAFGALVRPCGGLSRPWGGLCRPRGGLCRVLWGIVRGALLWRIGRRCSGGGAFVLFLLALLATLGGLSQEIVEFVAHGAWISGAWVSESKAAGAHGWEGMSVMARGMARLPVFTWLVFGR